MRIDAEKLATNGLRLDLDTADRRRLLELGPSGAVTGTYQLDKAAHRIHAGASHALTLTNFEWDLGAARLVLTSHGKLERVKVDLVVVREGGPTTGTITCGALTAAAVELYHPALGDRPLTIRSLWAKQLRIAIEPGRMTVAASRIGIGAVELEHPPLSLRLEGLSLPSGLWLDESAFEAKSVRLEALTCRASSLAELLSREGPRRKRKPTAPPPSTAVDLRLLDFLSGRVDVDVTVEAAIKALGTRKATHRFRLPIRSGTVNFKTLERSLARLEDSILDFAVDGDTLELVKDIPLIPFDTRTLVRWQLDRHDRSLAAQNRVRLARLLHYELPEPKRKKTAPQRPRRSKGSPTLQLEAVRCDEIDVALRLRGPTGLSSPQGGRIVLGTSSRPAIGKAQVRGSVHVRPGQRTEPTTLTGRLERLRGGLEELTLGGWQVDVGAITVAQATPLRVAMLGAEPTEGEAVLGGVKLARLRAQRRG